MHDSKRPFSIVGLLAGGVTLAAAGVAAAQTRAPAPVRYDDTELRSFEQSVPPRDPTGSSDRSGSGPGIQAAADRIIMLQCDPPGGWGWELTCPPTYNNLTGPIGSGLLRAYELTGDAATLAAAEAGGDYDMAYQYGNGEYRFSAGTSHFLRRLTEVGGDAQYSDHAAVEFFDELTAKTYGPSDLDTAGWIASVVAARAGAWVNLIPWEFADIAPTAGLIGNANSTTPPDGVTQEQKFIDGILAGLNTLDNTDPDHVYSDLIGLAGGVQGLAMTGTTSFPAIVSPNHAPINGITTLCALADVLAGFQNPDGSWYWHSNLAAPGALDKDSQTTAYALIALVHAHGQGCGPYDTEIALARGWLRSLQAPSGGYLDPYWGENAEVNGEILDAISLATFPAVENLDTSELFDTIQDAIDDADTLDGHTLEMLVNIHLEGPQIHFTKDLTLQGASPDTIKANGNTGSSGDTRGWFLVDDGVVLHVQDLEFDGNGYNIYQAFRHKGSGTFADCGFTDIKFPTYMGVAIAAFNDGDGPIDISGCTFDEIGRVGVLYYGPGITGSVYSGNAYTGKGNGDWLDYGVELGGGAVATVTNSTITDCRGVASSDGSTSAGILITTYYAPGTDGTVTNTTVTANSTGIFVGYDASDTSVAALNYNSIYANTSYGVYSTAPLVDAENNWWGDASGPDDPAGTWEADNPPCYDPDPTPALDVINADGLGDGVSDGNVAYCPWLNSPGTLSLVPDDTCYEDGDAATLTVDIRMSDLKDYVVGGQFFLAYDNTTLDFVSADPGDPPFTVEVFELVNEGAGTIDYAAGAPGGDPGTPLDTVMARLTFEANLETCDTADLITWRAHNPPTRLTNDLGGEISVITNNLGAITIDGTPPVVTPPDDIEVNADAGACTAYVTVPALVVDDACSGIDTVENDYNFTADASDTYPSGTTTVTWTVTDTCGNETEVTQDITVYAVNDMIVDIALGGGVMDPGIYTRCITFELWETGCGASVLVDADITFTSGLALGAVVEVPCGDYECITAMDELHTLRKTDDDDFAIVGIEYVADFTGADALVGGNLNGDQWIDILDYGIFVGQYPGAPGASTICGYVGPHADIDADGVVFVSDFPFISLNFLQTHETNCCGAPTPLAGWNTVTPALDGPITRISTKELRRRGLEDLIKADLNHDGWLDVRDMEAFANGARP